MMISEVPDIEVTLLESKSESSDKQFDEVLARKILLDREDHLKIVPEEDDDFIIAANDDINEEDHLDTVKLKDK